MRFDINTLFGVHEQAVLVRSKRAEVLAGNLANVDTPNYKARDIDFKLALQRSMQKERASNLTMTHENHSNGRNSFSSLGSGMELLYRSPMQPSVDGNTVDSQIEKAQFASNAMQYQASLQFLTGKIKNTMKAIRGE